MHRDKHAVHSVCERVGCPEHFSPHGGFAGVAAELPPSASIIPVALRPAIGRVEFMKLTQYFC